MDVGYWHLADIPSVRLMSAFRGQSRHRPIALQMSASDPKRTWFLRWRFSRFRVLGNRPPAEAKERAKFFEVMKANPSEDEAGIHLANFTYRWLLAALAGLRSYCAGGSDQPRRPGLGFGRADAQAGGG